MRRFYELVTSFARPSLMKIDGQGAELMVLRHGRAAKRDRLPNRRDKCDRHGAQWARIHRGCRIYERSRLVLFDIVAVNRRPLDLALAQMDAVFVPETSPLRRDHRWAA
jgi:hypothetical protein